MRRLLFIAAVLWLTLLAAPALAQGNAPVQWRAIYDGQLGGQQATLDLALADDGFAFARLTRAGVPMVLEGVGTHQPSDGSVQLQLHAPGRKAATSVALDFAYQTAEATGGVPTADPPTVATLTGVRSVDWSDDGDALEVTLRFTGAGSDIASADDHVGTLERVAQYAYGSLVEGRLDLGYAYPRFTGAAGSLNSLLERQATGRVADWASQGRSILDSGSGLGWAWNYRESVDLVGSAATYRSLISSFFYYTGGAHPNSHSESLLVRADGAALLVLGLAELFQPDSGWLQAVGNAVLEGLAEQGAAAVVDGSLRELTEEDLSTFTLGPGGMTFHFDPYAVGPYVQGAFLVTVDYGRLTPLARPGGAVAAFAELYAAP